jgi:ankyrin repeat protein
VDTTQSFFEAIRTGDREIVTARLDADPSLASARDAAGLSAVLTAAYHGRRELAAYIAGYGAELSPFERTVVGDEKGIRALLDADPAWATRLIDDGWTLLHGAAFFAQTPLVRLLLERGADPLVASTNQLCNHPLHAALAGGLDAEGVTLLLDAGADVNARQHGGYTALHAAAQHGNVEMVRLLLSRGADATIRTDDERTAAGLARENGHDAVAAMLEPPVDA